MALVRHIAVALLLAFSLAARSFGSETVYFLIDTGYSEFNCSYVVPLTKDEDIAYARKILKDASGTNPILVGLMARIAAGADGINRNYSVLAAPEWNWHITEVEGLGQGSLEDTMEGNAILLEWDPALFIALYGEWHFFWFFSKLCSNHKLVFLGSNFFKRGFCW